MEELISSDELSAKPDVVADAVKSFWETITALYIKDPKAAMMGDIAIDPIDLAPAVISQVSSKLNQFILADQDGFTPGTLKDNSVITSKYQLRITDTGLSFNVSGPALKYYFDSETRIQPSIEIINKALNDHIPEVGASSNVQAIIPTAYAGDLQAIRDKLFGKGWICLFNDLSDNSTSVLINKKVVVKKEEVK